MAKTRDFTDYRMAIHGAGEHTTTDIHIRFLPKQKNNVKSARQTPAVVNYDAAILQNLPGNADITAVKYADFKYLFESQRDRAYRTKKAAWSKWESKHPIKSLKEIFRTKKIGYLIYREPDSKPCGSACAKCKATNDPRWKNYPNCYTEVEAYHHSIIRQPSGRLRTDPPQFVVENGRTRLDDTEVVTPFMLKVRIENRFYRDQFKSFKFGAMKAFSGHRVVYLIIGVAVAAILILYFTGNLPI